MAPSTATERLLSEAILARHLAALGESDPRLLPVIVRAGPVALRTTPTGFHGLAKIICGQQLSVASAGAIWNRYAALDGALDAGGYLGLDEAIIRATGFSNGKIRTLRGVAEAVRDGALDFSQLDGLPAEAAIAALTALKGIGPWTAEVYLLFCAGHPDVFPGGDLALQKAVAHALGLSDRPDAKTIAPITRDWSPYRGAAALLFWRYFAALRDREGILL
jgi:DNA-3-methyladenine glycosylase II